MAAGGPGAGSQKYPAGLKYATSIAGGKGVVVGDYATVFQSFTDAASPLSALIRVPQFRALIDERTNSFVGREFVFAAIDAALDDSRFPSGYIVIQGEPGIGKTALMGQLVKSRGYVHHFNVSPMGVRSADKFLSNVCAQLIVRHMLDYAVLPPEATKDGGFLARLLTEVADEPANLPLVVVVDALDEAEDVALQTGANRLFLPPNLPDGVFFVVSTRPQYDYRLFVERRRDIYVRDDDPENLADVRTYIRSFLDENRADMTRRVEHWGVGQGIGVLK